MGNRMKVRPIDFDGHQYFVYDPESGLLYWKQVTSQKQRRLLGVAVGSQIADSRWQVKLFGLRYYYHRVIWTMYNGQIPDGMYVDHVDCDPSNNRLENLRLATSSQNQHNRSKNRRSASGFKGVTWNSRAKKWRARIRLNGKPTHLGYYHTPKEAHAVYCTSASRLHGQFANFGNDERGKMDKCPPKWTVRYPDNSTGAVHTRVEIGHLVTRAGDDTIYACVRVDEALCESTLAPTEEDV